MKFAFSKDFFTPHNIIAIALAVFGTYLVWPIYFEAQINPLPSNAPTWMSLDPSAMLHWNYANIKNFVWGVDIAYTYGPLAYLSTKFGWGEPRMHFLLYDMFVGLNFLLVFYYSYRESRSKLITAIIVIGFLIVFPVWVGATNSLILMSFLIFWIRKSLDNPKIAYYIFQILIVVLVFFMKFNTGLIAFPLLYSGIVYNLILFRKSRKHIFILLSAAVLPIVLILLLSVPLNVALLPYIASGIEMISGYNEIMYIDHLFKNRLLALLILAFSSSVLVYKTIEGGKENLLRNLTVSFLFGTSIFVAYKQGFVRGMEIDFFMFSLLIILAIPDLHSFERKKFVGLFPVACVLVSLFFVLKVQQVPANIGAKLDKMYIAQFKDFTPESGFRIFPNNNQLPESVKNQIGNATVDVYPWNLQMLLENKLNLSARPAYQSYSTYTRYLEDLNFAHYNRKTTAPEFVIYELTSVDYRYPFFDEAKLNMLLTKNYSLAQAFDFDGRKLLLLQKNANFRPVRLEKVNEYAMPLGSILKPQQDIFYEIEHYNTLMGKIFGIFDHAPKISLEIECKDPNAYFKTSNKLLQAGIFSDTYFGNTSEFGSYLTSRQSAQSDKVRYYAFRPENPGFFKNKFKVTEYRILQ